MTDDLPDIRNCPCCDGSPQYAEGLGRLVGGELGANVFQVRAANARDGGGEVTHRPKSSHANRGKPDGADRG